MYSTKGRINDQRRIRAGSADRAARLNFTFQRLLLVGFSARPDREINRNSEGGVFLTESIFKIRLISIYEKALVVYEQDVKGHRDSRILVVDRSGSVKYLEPPPVALTCGRGIATKSVAEKAIELPCPDNLL